MTLKPTVLPKWPWHPLACPSLILAHDSQSTCTSTVTMLFFGFSLDMLGGCHRLTLTVTVRFSGCMSWHPWCVSRHSWCLSWHSTHLSILSTHVLCVSVMTLNPPVHPQYPCSLCVSHDTQPTCPPSVPMFSVCQSWHSTHLSILSTHVLCVSVMTLNPPVCPQYPCSLCVSHDTQPTCLSSVPMFYVCQSWHSPHLSILRTHVLCVPVMTLNPPVCPQYPCSLCVSHDTQPTCLSTHVLCVSVMTLNPPVHPQYPYSLCVIRDTQPTCLSSVPMFSVCQSWHSTHLSFLSDHDVLWVSVTDSQHKGSHTISSTRPGECVNGCLVSATSWRTVINATSQSTDQCNITKHWSVQHHKALWSLQYYEKLQSMQCHEELCSTQSFWYLNHITILNVYLMCVHMNMSVCACMRMHMCETTEVVGLVSNDCDPSK